MTHNTTQQEAPAGGPLSFVEPWDLVADAYSAEMVSWGEHFARHALQLASLPPSPHIVDVACGRERWRSWQPGMDNRQRH